MRWLVRLGDDAMYLWTRSFELLARMVVPPSLVRLVLPGRRETPAEEALTRTERERIRLSFWRLRRAFQELSDADFGSDLRELLDDILGGAEGLGATFSAWMELVEELVQEAERRHGSQSGKGAVKARQVKADFLYLSSRLELQVPKLPAWALPLVLDGIADVMIAMVVRLLNRHEMWTEPRRKAPVLRRLWRSLVAFVVWLLEPLARALTRITWSWVLHLHPVSGESKAIIDRFVADRPQEVLLPFQRLGDLLAWIVGNARELATVVDIVSVAVLETEHFLDAPGEVKRIYARELILELIDDLVGLPRSPLVLELIERSVELGIDVVVRLFDKRELLRPSRRTEAEPVDPREPVHAAS